MTASGGNRSDRRGQRARLTSEDRSLWQRIASTVGPLTGAKPRVPDVETPAADLPAHAAPQRASPEKPVPRAEATKIPPSPPRLAQRPSRHAPEKAPSPLPAVERRQARRIASGAIEIEARLDLHGLTQTVAHGRLISFLQRSAADGLKTVLVITGKGAARDRTSYTSRAHDGEEYGVLRRSVPRWLAEAPLRALVISFQTAAPRHGGEGAFYLLLRRNRRAGDR